MQIFKRYFWQETSVSIFFVMLGLLAMFSFFDLIQELDALGRGNYGINSILAFVFLSIPGHIYDVAPVAVLVGMMYSLSALARDSELVVMRVSGMSLFTMGATLLKVGLLFTCITFFVGELIAPISEKMAQKMRVQATDSVIAQDFKSGIWIKDGSSFVNAQTVMPDGSLLDIHIFEFDDQFRLSNVNSAETGAYVKERKKWALTKVSQTQFSYAEKLEDNTVKTQLYNKANWHSLIKPELVNVLTVLPEKMSAWGLYRFIKHLKKNNQKTTRYEMALWAKMVYPLACIVMIILALPFGFLQQRSGGISAKIFTGIAIGVIYQIMNRVFSNVGTLYDWSPIVSAVTPTLLFLLAGISMTLWIERR